MLLALGILAVQEFLERDQNLEIHSRRLLSPAEASFYKFLNQTIQSRYIINCQTPLQTFLKKSQQQSMSKRLYTMYKSGHIDFLLLHPLSTEPILAIELDDSTHITPAAKDRDQRKEQLLTAANLPLVRISTTSKWGEVERQAILSKLNDRAITSLSEQTVNQNVKTRPHNLA